MNDALQKLITENEIQNLLARFDDAVIIRDIDAFRTLWTDDAEWEISDPFHMLASGIDTIVATLLKFDVVNEFFFRSSARPVIHLSENAATVRTPTVEIARRAGGKGYENVALYVDKVVLVNGQWLFQRRFYQYIWVDTETPLNGQIVSFNSGAG